jgi:hypothetical protein
MGQIRPRAARGSFGTSWRTGTEYIGKPHGSGVVERVLVHEGTITVGPASDPLTLGPGDFARYGADRLHVYRSADEDCHGVLLVGYPPA